MPRILIVPDIRSLQNVGSLFRTADGAGWEKIILCGYTPTPPREEISKVALGAETWIPWEYFADTNTALAELKTAGFFIVALELTPDSVDYRTFDTSLHPKLALLLGNETGGVPPETLALCDAVIHLPMRGRKESLNVAVAAAVAMYQLAPEK